MPPNDDSVPYTPLPPAQNVVVVLPVYRQPRRHNRLYIRNFIVSSATVLLIAAAFYFVYPSDPAIQLTRLRLNHVRVHSSPKLTLDLSFSLTIKVRNRDFFSLNYDSLVVSVGYRGRELGFVSSDGGRVRARGSSYVNATLDLDGFEVIHDVFYLIEDLAKGVIPFDTDSMVEGKLVFFFFKIPLKTRVSCEVYVNTNNQTIIHQDCYAKVEVYTDANWAVALLTDDQPQVIARLEEILPFKEARNKLLLLEAVQRLNLGHLLTESV